MALSTFQQLLILLLLLGLLLLLLKVVPSLPLSLWLLLLLLLLLDVCRCQTSLLHWTTCAPVFENNQLAVPTTTTTKNAFTKQPALYSSLDSHPLEPTQRVHESFIYNAIKSKHHL
jgi:hypothetical protein